MTELSQNPHIKDRALRLRHWAAMLNVHEFDDKYALLEAVVWPESKELQEAEVEDA